MSGESEAPASLEQSAYEAPAKGNCDVEHVDYQIYGRVTRSGVFTKAVTTGNVVLTVAESQSVIDCHADVVSVAAPGSDLATKAVQGDSFSLDVQNVIIAGQRPSIWVGAVLDTNDNGECDPGELSGALEVSDTELGNLAIELSDQGCPGRV